MKYLDLPLPTPAENLACDEALLDWCEEGCEHEILRFWEPTEHFVVVGYANKVASEVNAAACDKAGIPIFRRCTGGGAVLQGPGCLNYTLILRISKSGPLHGVASTNRFIMSRNARALEALLRKPVKVQGHTDLTSDSLKFSGNSQRRRRAYLLFHGSFLLNLDVSLVERCMFMPAKQPSYRQNRRHTEFMVNLAVPSSAVKAALRKAWHAKVGLKGLPSEQIAALTREKYATTEWNFSR